MKKKRLRRRVYDESWKQVLEKYFWQFLEFYFPERLKYINKAKGYRFREQELHKITPSSEIKKRRVDKLAEVYLKEEEKLWLLVHVEIQTYKDKKFAERMFSYNYRIFDKFKMPAASLAILGDPVVSFRPNSYTLEALGKRFINFEFDICKLLDWKGREDELKQNNNIFAIVTLSQIKSWEKPYNKLFKWKLELSKLLYERGYDKETVISLLRFMDGIMVLPDELEIEYKDEISKIEEEKKMPYVTTIERMAEKRGEKRGIIKGKIEGEKKGIIKGKIEGKIEGKQNDLLMILKLRFGEINEELRAQIEAIEDIKKLDNLIGKAVTAANLEEFEI